MKKEAAIIFAIILLSPLALAMVQTEKEQYRACNADCTAVKRTAQDTCKEQFLECKEDCEDNKCVSTCSKQRNLCLKEANQEHKNCKNSCKPLLAKKCTVGENTYIAGEEFQDGCDICECKTTGKISCKKESFCNKDPQISQQLCEESGGFYQALCNGPYFHMSCSQNKYCQCGGTYEYTCPENYECLTEFVPPKIGNYVPGYRNLLGQPLGDVGVCVQ